MDTSLIVTITVVLGIPVLIVCGFLIREKIRAKNSASVQKNHIGVVEERFNETAHFIAEHDPWLNDRFQSLRNTWQSGDAGAFHKTFRSMVEDFGEKTVREHLRQLASAYLSEFPQYQRFLADLATLADKKNMVSIERTDDLKTPQPDSDPQYQRFLSSLVTFASKEDMVSLKKIDDLKTLLPDFDPNEVDDLLFFAEFTGEIQVCHRWKQLMDELHELFLRNDSGFDETKRTFWNKKLFETKKAWEERRYAYVREALTRLAPNMTGVAISPDLREKFTEVFTYFADFDPLYHDVLQQVEPVILNNPGILQNKLAEQFPRFSAEQFRYVMYYAHLRGDIRREKNGRSYAIFAQ
jgi:hypothetical protein